MEGMEKKVVSECFELKGKHALLALTSFAQAYPPDVSKLVGIGNWLHVPAGVIVFVLFKKEDSE